MNLKHTIRRSLGAILILLICYFLGIFVYGWLSDWQPEAAPTTLPFDQVSSDKMLTDSVFTFVTWNVGFGGLGAESDFFYDDEGIWYSGSSMTQTPRNLVEKNLAGALGFFQQYRDSVDFFLLQEVDIESDRSHRIMQYDAYQKSLPGFMADFALNYKCDRVPIPLLEPWNAYGAVLSGLATFSRFQPVEATRHQLPGHYPMPDRIFQLDRCAALHRYPTTRNKELVIINLHNSAYDPGDKIKAIQLPYLRDLAQAEYAKGNYVILGGDWNQCPPHFRFDSFMPGNAQGYVQGNLPPDFFPEDWAFAYDPTVPTNRKARDPYLKGKTFEILIDFFLVSPNVRIRSVKAVNQGFQYSDHQPVMITVELQ
ncbi:MAG: endonuclease/exonuclease/phosphatase family protein [Lewinellaceae bacterium]|nr:endonuclease/exonuclease/phosphatase family protein [Lewinellaceae bacterium]